MVCLGHARPNIFAMKETSRYTMESRWLMTFNLEVEPYLTQLSKIFGSVSNLDECIKYYIDKYGENHDRIPLFKTRLSHLNMLNSQIGALQQKVLDINDMFHTLPKRQKRSLLPFIGSFLSTLTGTATLDDIKMINDRLELLNDKNYELSHILSDSITVVNASRVKINSISKTVDQLIHSM